MQLEPGWLTSDQFRQLVGLGPLVSIDLLVLNERNELLLGQRVHRPAQGTWFVPGGRVRKNERLDHAFERLTLTELGLTVSRREAKWMGVFEHFYADSALAEAGQGPDTHYVVLAYQIGLPAELALQSPNDQHTRFAWWPLADIPGHAEVHPMTQAYVPHLTRGSMPA